jgi:hypothetical protein
VTPPGVVPGVVWVCYEQGDLKPGWCTRAVAYVCSGTDAQKTVRVEKYFSGMNPERSVLEVSVPPHATATAGSGPFIGYADEKSLEGVCYTRQYTITVLK